MRSRFLLHGVPFFPPSISLFLPDSIYGDSARYAKKPGSRRSPASVSGTTCEDPQERLLGHVFGKVTVSGYPPGHGVQSSKLAVDQLLEGDAIPRLGTGKHLVELFHGISGIKAGL
jgi:hypothetical protein